jgi:hypothetical protein
MADGNDMDEETVPQGEFVLAIARSIGFLVAIVAIVLAMFLMMAVRATMGFALSKVGILSLSTCSRPAVTYLAVYPCFPNLALVSHFSQSPVAVMRTLRSAHLKNAGILLGTVLWATLKAAKVPSKSFWLILTRGCM